MAVDLPFHLYGYVDRAFLSNGEQEGWEPAVWFGLTAPANRAFGLTVLLECGAVYRHVPPHAWAFTTDSPKWTLKEAQAWDSFGRDTSAIEYRYLRELEVTIIRTGLMGIYRFTIEFDEDGFSREPTQSKCLHAIQLDNGRLTFQPNDRLLWKEASFTKSNVPKWLRRQTQIYWSE